MLKFKYPLHFDQIFVRINREYKDKKARKFYIETYNELGFRLARVEPSLISTNEWTLVTLPPDSNTETSMIVIS